MHGFDLDHLRTFVAAVEAGSLTAAAPRRFRSQSSVSEQLRKLETAAGQPLLLRAKQGVRPTRAGQRLLVHARQILALSDAAWRELHDIPLAGELRLAITEYFRPDALSMLLARLHQHYPEVRLHVHMDRSDAIDQAYARGDCDVAVTMQAAGQRAAAGATVLRREPLLWVGSGVRKPDQQYPLRLVTLSPECTLRQLATARLEARRIPYVIAHVASGVAGIQSAVAAGLGVACLNAAACGPSTPALPRAWRLPALPEVVFRMAPLRAGASSGIAAMHALVREALQT